MNAIDITSAEATHGVFGNPKSKIATPGVAGAKRMISEGWSLEEAAYESEMTPEYLKWALA